MTEVRDLFLAAAASVRALLDDPHLDEHWSDPSALDRMSVGDLAGHLMRAITSVGAYLDRPEPGPEEPVFDAPGYFLSIEGLNAGPDHELHRAIRERAAAEAAGGPDPTRQRWDSGLADLGRRLPGLPDNRRVSALGGRSLLLDDYLVTRLVELLVHADDLAVSLDADIPTVDPEVHRLARQCLVTVAVGRHGDVAVLRALTRRERDTISALRVL